jgi:hypothetical protein
VRDSESFHNTSVLSTINSGRSTGKRNKNVLYGCFKVVNVLNLSLYFHVLCIYIFFSNFMIPTDPAVSNVTTTKSRFFFSGLWVRFGYKAYEALPSLLAMGDGVRPRERGV